MFYRLLTNDAGMKMIVPFDQSKHSVAELIPIEGDTVIIIDVPSSFRLVIS